VIDESPNHRTNENAGTTLWTGRKLHEPERGAEEVGHSMRDGVWRTFNLGRRRGGDSGDGGIAARGGGEEVEMENRTRMRRPTTADTLVADENIDGHPAPDGSRYPREEGDVAASASTPTPAPGPVIGGDTGDTTAAAPVESDSSAEAPRERRHKRRSRSLTRLPSRIDQNQQAFLGGNRHPLKITPTDPPDTVNLNLDTDDPVQFYDDYDYDVANASNADNKITEVPRGRKGRLGMTTTMPRTMSGSSLIPSSALLPAFSSPTMPLQYSPHLPPASYSRPRTAPTSPTTPTTTISPSTTPVVSIPNSRPATADGNGSIRHHRLDSILASSTTHLRQGHLRTPTRESSPSRSVRFIDYVDGESGYVGPSGPVRDSNGGGSTGNGGRTVLTVEIPPPPSRSYSFSKDKDGNGRSMVE